MSWFKKIFLILIVAAGLISPTFVFADKFGIDNAAQGTNLIQTSQTIPEIIGSIVGIALSFVGIIFFLLILYAGFTWMTAFGNEEKVTTSKSIMEQAAIGLVIVLAAYAISRFVFSSLPATTTGQANPTSPMGCCYVTTAAFNDPAGNPVPASCTPQEMDEPECQLWGTHGSWQQGACAASCP